MCFGIFKLLFGPTEEKQKNPHSHEYKETGNHLDSTAIDAEFSDGKSNSSSSSGTGSSSDSEDFEENNMYNKGEKSEKKEEVNTPKEDGIKGEESGNVDLLHFDVNEAKKEEKQRFGAKAHENFKKSAKTMMKKRKLKVKKKEPVKKTEVK